ncbi:hypothetical protein ASE63_20270 [Bosea sp. Root381]|nr:hypothetical protein ASE63_20270 [Bosea sp. Root381]
MLTPIRGFLGFIQRIWCALALGQILREEYIYEVHGPFVAVAPARPKRSFFGRLIARLAASIGGLAFWSSRHRGVSSTR